MIHPTRVCIIRPVLFCLLSLPSALPAQPGFSSLSTVWITVKYQKGIPEADARRVGDYLQSDVEYLNTTLGVSPAGKIEVRVYDSPGKYLDATRQQRSWRPALWQRGVMYVQPVSALTAAHTFEKSLSFELALAVLERTGEKGCPVWLRTAYAVYHSGIMSDLTAPVGTRANSFGDLDEELQHYPAPPRRDDVLYLLGQTMKFFVERFGETKALGVFQAFTGMASADDILAAHFGLDARMIEKEWSKYIAAHAVPFRNPR